MNKKIIFILFISMSCIYLYYKYTKSENKYIIEYEIEKELIDIGRIHKDDRSIATFKIKNTGNSDIEIEDIVPDCHCTVPTWNSEPIKKGEDYSLLVEYDNNSLGFFEQTITVFFKSDKNPPPLLVMQGVIIK